MGTAAVVAVGANVAGASASAGTATSTAASGTGMTQFSKLTKAVKIVQRLRAVLAFNRRRRWATLFFNENSENPGIGQKLIPFFIIVIIVFFSLSVKQQVSRKRLSRKCWKRSSN